MSLTVAIVSRVHTAEAQVCKSYLYDWSIFYDGLSNSADSLFKNSYSAGYGE